MEHTEAMANTAPRTPAEPMLYTSRRDAQTAPKPKAVGDQNTIPEPT